MGTTCSIRARCFRRCTRASSRAACTCMAGACRSAICRGCDVTAREVVRARNEAEVANAVLAALADKSPFEIVSSGSKRTYGRPVSAERILDISALKGIIKYEPEELVVSAHAATPIKEIEAALAERKQMLGFEPVDWSALLGGHQASAT